MWTVTLFVGYRWCSWWTMVNVAERAVGLSPSTYSRRFCLDESAAPGWIRRLSRLKGDNYRCVDCICKYVWEFLVDANTAEVARGTT